MKTKSNPFLRNLALTTSFTIVATASALAASATWNVAGDGDWNVPGNWNPGVPGAAANTSTTDTAGFGGSTNYTVYLSGSRSINTVTYSSTGTTALLGGSSATAANEIISLFSGLTINASTGAVTIGDTAASPTRKVDIRMGSSTIANNSSSLLTIANGLQSRGTGSTTTITLGGTGNTTVSGVVGGGLGAAVAITKDGAGMLTLSNSNSYSGTTTINNGIVRITNDNALGGNGGGTNNGTTVASAITARLELANGITTRSNEALTISARTTNEASLSSVSGNNIWAGTINTATGGGLYNLESQAGVLSISGNLVNANTGNRTWQLMGAGDGAISGTINDGSGTVSVTKYSGSGTWTLSVANDYSGTTSINAGVLRPTHANALGSTTGGTTASAGSLELTGGLTPNTAEVMTISGSGDKNFGALRAGTGGGTWAGPIAIGTAGARLGATAGNTLTITGTIADGAANTFAISGESGTGVVVINPTTSNTYTGKTDIVRGILRLGKTDALPTGTMLDVDSASGVADPAVLDLASFNQTAGGLRDGATSSFSGKVTNSVAATTSTLTLNQTEETFYEGTIEDGAGTVVLVKNGSGTLNLNRANTYTGATSVNDGRLNIGLLSPAGITLTSPVTVASGAAIGGEGTSSASLTFGTGTSTLFFNPTTAESLTTASVTATGAVVVTPEGSVTTGNTYVVLTNSAGFPGTPAATYVPSSRGTLAFAGPLSGGLPTELQFTAAAPVTTLIWKGNAANPSFWDINTTANWDNGSGPDKFFDFDSVAFDDSATNTTIIIQPDSVTVGSMDFNNPTKNYDISGGSIKGTGGLVKSGNASLTLSNANSFTGGATLNAGTLNINNATALGTAAGQFIIAGGTINNTSGVPVITPSYPLTIDADINFTGSNDLNLGAGATTLGSNPGPARTITTAAGTLRLGGAIADGSGGANEITKAGNGTLTLSGANSFTGTTTISAGTLVAQNNAAFGSAAVGTIISSGATLSLGGTLANDTLNLGTEPFTVSGSGVGGNGAIVASSQQINAIRNITLAANASFGGTGRWDMRGTGATLNLADFTLTKSGSSYVALVGTSVTPGAGHIDITGGVLSIQTTTNMGGTAANTITVRNGATLDCYQTGTWTAPNWSVLMDAGSSFTNSNGTAIWDGTVALNGAANLGGTLDLTLNGVVSGASGALTKTGAGTLNLAGTAANTYGGLTTVSAGTLALGKTAGVNAVPGNITIGAGGVSLQADDQIPNASTVTLTTATSKFNLNSKAETLANLDIQNASNTTAQGLVTGGSPGGKLTITGTLTHTLGNITLNSSGPGNSSTIDANTVINNGGSWIFGTTDGTQKLLVGPGGLTIGNGSTIAVGASATAANFISLGGNVTSTAAATTNTISGAGKLNLNATRTFTVADDTPASDLTVSTVIADADVSGTGAIVKEGAGTMTLGAANTYTGDTTVNAGTLALGLATAVQNSPVITVTGGTTLDASAVAWALGAAQTLRGNGTVSGATTLAGTVAPGTVGTTGTLTTGATTLSGTYACDVTAAACDLLTVNGSLTLTGATLAITAVAPAASSYTIATYTGAAPAFTTVTGLPSGYTLDYATAGVIKLVQSGSPYTTWGAAYGLGAGTEGLDLDNDGLTNFQEFAFGLIPNSGSSVNPITVQLNKTTGQFSYQRLNASGLAYTIWTSPDLVTWTIDGTANQTVTTGTPNDSVQVTLSASAPLAATKLFVRVKAN